MLRVIRNKSLFLPDADLSHATESKDVMFEAAALSHVSSTFQHVVQSKRAVECAQAIVFIRHESRYLIVPDSKVHHGVSEGCKDAEGSLTAWVRECSLNFDLVSPCSGWMVQTLKQR